MIRSQFGSRAWLKASQSLGSWKFNWFSRLGMLALAGAILFTPAPAGWLPPVQRHFRIEASTSQFSPAVLHVNPGDQVTIDLVATDVVHGLSVDGYDVSLTADPGQTSTTTFIASKSGVFHIRCSIPCGALHPFISGRLVVGPNWTLLRAAFLAILVVLSGLFLFRP